MTKFTVVYAGYFANRGTIRNEGILHEKVINLYIKHM